MQAFLLLVLFFQFPAVSTSKPVFQLDSDIRKNYLALLNQAADFHKVIEKKHDNQAIKKEIQEAQKIIVALYSQLLSVDQFHHKIHSHKLLNSIEEQLTAINNPSLNKQAEKQNIKKLFNSFFELAQVYDLKKDMKNKIFYCPKDKSLWFQESSKPKNPINPNYKNCGQRLL